MEERPAKDVAAEIGVAPGVLQQLEAGRGITSDHLGAVLAWLLAPDPEAIGTQRPLFKDDDTPPATAAAERTED